MAHLNIFKIEPDGQTLTINANATPLSSFNSVKLWTQDTFRDYNNYYDFTSKLTTGNNQQFTISASEIQKTSFDGIYFLEMVDTSGPSTTCSTCSNVILGVATDLSRFTFCLIEYLCAIESQCAGCDNELHKALTMKLYIDGLKNSLQLGKFTTAITFWKNLNRACSATCVECSKLSDISKKGLGFQTLGGEILLY